MSGRRVAAAAAAADDDDDDDRNDEITLSDTCRSSENITDKI